MSDKSIDDWSFDDNNAEGSVSQISKQSDESFSMEWINYEIDEVARKDTDIYPELKDNNNLSLPLELNAYQKKSADCNEFIQNFEENIGNVNLDKEAENFILSKPGASVFHQNFDYNEKKMISSQKKDVFQNFLTSRLKDAIERCHRQEAIDADISSENGTKSEEKFGTRMKRMQSPDLFEESSDDESSEKLKDNEEVSRISIKRTHSPDLFEESSDDVSSEKLKDNEDVSRISKKQTHSSDLFEISSDEEMGPTFEINKSNQNLSPNLFGLSANEHTVMTRSKSQASQGILQSSCYISDDRRAVLVSRIEDFILKLLTDLVKTSNMKFTLPKTTEWKNCGLVDGILTLNNSETLRHRTVSLKNTGSKFRIALIMYILSEMYHQLILGTTCTVRELYYQDPDLAKNQTNVSNAIRDICVILDVTPWEIGIHSSSKGLITGAIRMTLSNDEIIDCSTYNGPTLLPNDVNGIKSIETNAKYLLIVEKDTIFEMLIKQNILTNIGHDIILITGKGFPDINTRLMVKKIWTEHKIPIYALVDADPFGIEILFVYKYGSRSMVHNSDKLACPQINWIGIHPSEIESLAIPSMALNNEDKKRIKDLIKRSYISDEIREELIVLERKNRKAEIEGVSSFSLNFLISDYIPNKIKRNLII